MALTPQQAQQPTTPTTEAETIAIVTAKYGAAIGAKFKTWYDAALKQDKNLTPDQATVTFLVGEGLSTNLGTAGEALGAVPGAAAKGASNAYKSLTSGPLSGIEAIGAFFNTLGQGSTWIRVAKVVIGGVLLISGIVHMTGIDKNALGIASKGIIPA